MKNLFYMTGILIFFTSAAIAQVPFPNDTTLRPVRESAANWDIIQKEIEQIEKTGPRSPVVTKVERLGRIEGKAIQALFPTWEFYAFVYSSHKRKGFDDKPVSLASSLGHTLAVDPDSKEVMRLYHYGNYETFGSLVKKTGVVIINADDARMVWDSFCEIHRKAWRDQKIEMVSATEWKLGIYSYDQTISVVDEVKTVVKRTHFMKVTTDLTSKRITEWQSIVETPNIVFEQDAPKAARPSTLR